MELIIEKEDGTQIKIGILNLIFLILLSIVIVGGTVYVMMQPVPENKGVPSNFDIMNQTQWDNLRNCTPEDAQRNQAVLCKWED